MESELSSKDGARDESLLSDITEVTLWFKFSVDGDWIPTLAIPVEDFGNYTLHPLKWLRFVGFAIYGRQGVLLTDRAGPPVDEDMGAESLTGFYYYSSPEPPRLVDVEALNDRQSDTTSFASSSRAAFVRDVVRRDRTCVLTNARMRVCDAAHLIPHSKGDTYIQHLTEFRSDSEKDVIQEINDPRNGLLLSLVVRRLLGDGEVAFLKTPNFALRTDEVPPSTIPVSGPLQRLTFQFFGDSDPTLVAQPNQDARLPNDLMHWPPSIITDFIYACVVVRKWGSKCSTQMFRDLTRDVYPKGHPSPPDIISQQHEQSPKQSQARSDRLAACNEETRRVKDVEHGDSHGTTLRREEQKPEMEEIMD